MWNTLENNTKTTTVQTNITRKGKYVWKKTLDDCHYRNTL